MCASWGSIHLDQTNMQWYVTALWGRLWCIWQVPHHIVLQIMYLSVANDANRVLLGVGWGQHLELCTNHESFLSYTVSQKAAPLYILYFCLQITWPKLMIKIHRKFSLHVLKIILDRCYGSFFWIDHLDKPSIWSAYKERGEIKSNHRPDMPLPEQICH